MTPKRNPRITALLAGLLLLGSLLSCKTVETSQKWADAAQTRTAWDCGTGVVVCRTPAP